MTEHHHSRSKRFEKRGRVFGKEEEKFKEMSGVTSNVRDADDEGAPLSAWRDLVARTACRARDSNEIATPYRGIKRASWVKSLKI